MIGIIGALNGEVKGLVAKLCDQEELSLGGTSFYVGKLHDKKTVVALSGVGKVNASMTASFMLACFPDVHTIINIGVAGGVAKEAKQGDLVLSTASVQHDYNTTAVGAPVGRVEGFDFIQFKSDPQLVLLAEKVLRASKLRYHKGVIATGDEFVNSDQKAEWLRNQFDAVACDMESGAIAHVCYKAGKKFLSMRAVSDNGDDNAETAFYDWFDRATQINIAFVCDLLDAL